MKSGTENVPGIVGLGKACEVAIRDFDRNVAHMAKLRNKLMEGILKIDHVRLNGHPTIRSPNNVNASFSFIEGESLVLFLDMAGIEASTGSACSSKNLKASHVRPRLRHEPRGGPWLSPVHEQRAQHGGGDRPRARDASGHRRPPEGDVAFI